MVTPAPQGPERPRVSQMELAEAWGRYVRIELEEGPIDEPRRIVSYCDALNMTFAAVRSMHVCRGSSCDVCGLPA